MFNRKRSGKSCSNINVAVLFVFLSVYSQCFSGSLYNYRIVKNLEKKIFFFYFTEICVIQTFMVFLFMNKKKNIRFYKIYFYLNINNKFNFTRVFFFKTLLYWVKAVWPRTLSNPWMYRSQRKAYWLSMILSMKRIIF